MITELTPAQEKLLVEVRDKWLSIGRSTALLNQERVREIVGKLYQRINKPTPRVLFFSSPMVCILAYGVFQTKRQLGGQLRDQLWGQLWGQLRDQLWGPLWGQLGDQLWGQLWGQLRNYIAGNQCCYADAFYDFGRQIGVVYSEESQRGLDLWIAQSREMHWWFPYEGVVLVSERPICCEVDEQGRLHSADRQAYEYSDGYGITAWHGVRIPPAYYQKETTSSEILQERNSEVRRALIERYDAQHGKGSFIQNCGAKVLDSAIQPMQPGQSDSINELLAIDLPEDPEGRMVALKVTDPSTGRTYIIRVPPDQTTVRGALAWSFNVAPEDYVLLQES